MSAETNQHVIDEEHLRLLALFHYISGGITVAFSSMFGVMFGMMSAMATLMPIHAPAPCPDADPCTNTPAMPEEFPGIFFGIFGVLLLLFLIFGVLEIISGRYISKHRRRVFSIVVSIPRILLFPYGTILWIFTLLVLERKGVQELYGESSGL